MTIEIEPVPSVVCLPADTGGAGFCLSLLYGDGFLFFSYQPPMEYLFQDDQPCSTLLAKLGCPTDVLFESC
jgi:hypothetical protein